MAHAADVPSSSAIVIRCGDGFTVCNDAGCILFGPYPSIGKALGVARQVAAQRRIWAETIDLGGQPIGTRVAID